MLTLLVVLYGDKRRANLPCGERAGRNMIIDAAGSEDFFCSEAIWCEPRATGGAARRPS